MKFSPRLVLGMGEVYRARDTRLDRSASVMAAILEREPSSVAAFTRSVPAVVDATIRRCLAKDPDQWWQSR